MKYTDKILGYCTVIYQIVIYNFLFLVTNSLLFQFYFKLDFNLIHLPLFAVASLTFLPSSLALARTIDTVTLQKSHASVMKSFWSNICTGLKEEWPLYISVTAIINLLIFNLYCLSGNSSFQLILFVSNLVLLFLGVILVLTLIGNSIYTKGKNLILLSVERMIRIQVKDIFIPVMLILMFIVLKFSYLSILFVFGCAFVAMVFYFRKGKFYGVSS